MPGSTNSRIYYTDHYPTRKQNRFSYLEAGRLLFEAGWPHKLDVMSTALAVMNAESARDPKAYLAYIDLGVDRNSDLGLARRAKIDALDDRAPYMTLTTYRYAIPMLTLGKCKVVRADVGLFQVGWPTHNESVSFLTNPIKNTKRALRIYRDNGNTFNPWAAYTTPRTPNGLPPYKWYMSYATEAIETLLDAWPEIQPE